ncbi:MAG: hypothetical protein HZA17_07205 [Nitrospirae bacterium]|nr:hypothetical protein [Nitrospirota bacterium]
MKRLGSILITAALMLMVGGVVYAGTADPGIQDRIEDQQQRIDQGIASGELTRAEADRMQDNLNRIKADEARLKADGKLTPRERARLNKELDHNSKAIYRKKHNPRRR